MSLNNYSFGYNGHSTKSLAVISERHDTNQKVRDGSVPMNQTFSKRVYDHFMDSRSENTKRSYKTIALVYWNWCLTTGRRLENSTANDIAEFLIDQSQGKYTAINWLNKDLGTAELSDGKPLAGTTLSLRLAGLIFLFTRVLKTNLITSNEWLDLRDILKGIQSRNPKEKKQMRAVTLNDLKMMNGFWKIEKTRKLRAVRDRAVLNIMFFAALRRSELCALNYEDCDFTSGGVILTIKKSKTSNVPQEIAVPYAKTDTIICPVRALKAWLEKSEIKSGPLFLGIKGTLNERLQNRINDRVIYIIWQYSAKQSGISYWEEIGSHSGRRGLVETAATAGRTMNQIMRTTRHKSPDVVAQYFEKRNIWENASIDL